jgi:catechol 2,3-dioxygenase-like lactoylglutathione lyase family enzyme
VTNWSAVPLRVARPTAQLEAVCAFYRDALGLEELGSFRDHDGYDGVMIGPAGASYHLEFTSHASGSPCPAPSRDNLLVFYLADRAAVDRLVERMRSLGHEPVAPENPYWRGRSVTFEDPDGWRVVLVDRTSPPASHEA